MVSVFLTTKSYFSCLVAELSQLCYIGVIRSVALGSTDGLCTWICTYLLGLQPVIVPAGRMSLGRIFNVVGAIIDRYLGFSLSSQFNILIPMDLGMFIESHEQYAYTLCYLNALQIFRQPLILFEFSCYIHNELFWYATTTINIDWLFYTCNLYLGLILKVNRPACPYTSMNECLTASLSLGCALHFFNAETHFAWFKPIHNTSVTIMGLSLRSVMLLYHYVMECCKLNNLLHS